jgi:hypothetical protein
MISDRAHLLALTNAFSCLITELQDAGSVDGANVIQKIQLEAGHKRTIPDPEGLAEALDNLAAYLLKTVPTRPSRK